MNLLYQFSENIYSMLLLSGVLVLMALRREYISTSGKLFRRLILVTVYMLALEMLTWAFDRKPGQLNYYANYFFNALFAWSQLLVVAAWLCYFDYQLFTSFERLKRRYFYLQTMLLPTLLLAINVKFPLLFTIDEDNVYQREPFLWLINVVAFGAYCYLCFLIWYNRELAKPQVTYFLTGLISLPFLGSVLQLFIYGVPIMWPTMSITLVLAYVYMETISTSRDYLTKLFSRQRVDNYIHYQIESRTPFALILLDLNRFKAINDTYGHQTGDRALQLFSAALSTVADGSIAVGRYGGDEFIVVCRPLSTGELIDFKSRLDDELDSLMQKQHFPADIHYSLGYSEWDADSDLSFEQLFNTADRRLYADKPTI